MSARMTIGKATVVLVMTMIITAAPWHLHNRQSEGVEDAVLSDLASVRIMAGQIDGTYLRLADDLAHLGAQKGIRVIPMVGQGSLQAIDDLMTMPDIDFAMMQSDALNMAALDDENARLHDHLRYIMPLYQEEFHLLAGKDIQSVWDLEGKSVSVGPESAGTHLTSLFIFEDLGISIDARSMASTAAMSALENREIAAMAYVVGQPAALFDVSLPSGLHFLPVPAEEIGGPYEAARLSPKHYPYLKNSIPTVAVSSVLATYMRPDQPARAERIDRFVKTAFQNFAWLRENDRHPKWHQVHPAVDIAGWQRLGSAITALHLISIPDIVASDAGSDE